MGGGRARLVAPRPGLGLALVSVPRRARWRTGKEVPRTQIWQLLGAWLSHPQEG